MRLVPLLIVLAAPSMARAEAGLPFEICRTGSCACNGVTCGCGQVCTASGCQSSTAAFCNNDSQCVASCGDFVCEFNNCRAGTRVDGGFVAGDGGQAGPMIDGGIATQPAVRGCGCSVGGGALWVGALALLLGRRHRRSFF